jgi:hypothetical protein
MMLLKLPPRQRAAYNPDRPASDLLKTHVQYAQELEKALPPEKKSGVTLDMASLTEGQAADYLERITRVHHPAGIPKTPPRRAPKKPKSRKPAPKRRVAARKPPARKAARRKPARRPSTRRPPRGHRPVRHARRPGRRSRG